MNAAILWAGTADSYSSLSEREIDAWLLLPSRQQPAWDDDWLAADVRRDLGRLPGIVDGDEVRALRSLLADVAAGRRQVLQAGDCAEDPAHCRPDALVRKVGLLDALAGVMSVGSGRPILRAGRIAGQFAKPRSSPMETAGTAQLPAFRGHLVNGPRATAEDRRHDPLRLLACHQAASSATAYLRRQQDASGSLVWTSHEALILDYELPQLRRDLDGSLVLTSTHWPWIGDRTRQLDGAHVHMLAAVSNPVACKVGPGMGDEELLRLCELLDPDRRAGRLTLIARLGADPAAERLPGLAARVRAAGHPVVWLCDPMHANTIYAADGRKRRLLTSVLREVREFLAALEGLGIPAGGLHLEATADSVVECLPDESHLDRDSGPYTSLCDPRLNLSQALAVAESWH